MKSAMNGGLNLSVLDGWWDEGYDGTNGWAIKPASERADAAARDADEARTLYEILQDQVVPLYYDRDSLAYSPGWVKMAKRSVATILPQFNASRMLNEYIGRFYGPAARRGRIFHADGCAAARNVAHWKARVREAWPGVSIQRIGDVRARASASGSACASRRAPRSTASGPTTSPSSWCCSPPAARTTRARSASASRPTARPTTVASATPSTSPRSTAARWRDASARTRPTRCSRTPSSWG